MWGAGQIVAGDRRGWLLPPLQAAAIAGLIVAIGAASGTYVTLVYLGGVAVLGAWVGIAAGAYRLAARRHAALDVAPRALGALDLLWLSPLVVVGSTLLWAYGGSQADPGSTLADYVDNWRSGRVDVAREQFGMPPHALALGQAWDRQLAALHNDLVRVSATARPDARIDPDHPLDTIVWLPAVTPDPGAAAFDIAVVRSATVRSQLLGLLPSTAQRVEVLERLGRVEIRRVELPGLAGQAWRISSADVGGIVVGAP